MEDGARTTLVAVATPSLSALFRDRLVSQVISLLCRQLFISSFELVHVVLCRLPYLEHCKPVSPSKYITHISSSRIWDVCDDLILPHRDDVKADDNTTQ